MRKGYINTDIDINEAGNEFIPLDIQRHNATFFAGNQKLKYYNWSTETIYDTGVSLTASFTSIAEYKGDLYGINATDGLQYFNIAKLTAAASSGAGSVFIDIDAVARLSAFNFTTGDIVIEGTSYAYTAINTSTGEITLSGTTSSAYSEGAITTIYKDKSASIPKGSMVFFWLNSMHIIGVEADSTDVPRYTLYFSDFALASTLENIFLFPAINTELVGDGGVIKNAMVTKNYLYLFTENQTYSLSKSSVNTVTGARPPEPFDRLHGTVNQNSVAAMDNSVAWLTQNKRIMFGQVRLEDGGLNIAINENFDNPVREILNQLDDDQSDAIVYYLSKSKELHIKVKIEGETIELVYDNNLNNWCPPDTNKFFSGVFERSGEPYVMSEDDDTIYKLNEGLSDDGAEIECIVAFGEFEGKDSRVTFDLKNMETSGTVAFGTEISYEPRMNYTDGTTHTISYLNSENIIGEAIGLNSISLSVVGGDGTIPEEREFDVRLGNYPARVRSFQPIFKALGEDISFSIKSWSVNRKEFNSFITTAI